MLRFEEFFSPLFGEQCSYPGFGPLDENVLYQFSDTGQQTVKSFHAGFRAEYSLDDNFGVLADVAQDEKSLKTDLRYVFVGLGHVFACE